jgi:uncharacterized protein YqjF (DUF2071 family)
MHMTWHDLLFMHWPVSPDLVRPLIPAGLELDFYDRRAWIGVVPFYMTDVRPDRFPRFMASRFPEVNVRTYVRHKGRPGVWFFSLDAADRVAVLGARRFYHLPYHFAEMSSVCTGAVVQYRSRRKSNLETAIIGRYWPAGDVRFTREGDLDHWLTARFSLFSANRKGEIFRGDVEHAAWPLQSAEAEMDKNTLAAASGIALPDNAPLLHFAKHLDVVALPLVRT